MLQEFMERSGLRLSQALRTAIALGLRDGEPLEDSFLRAMRREGVFQGMAILSAKIQGAISEAMQEIEGVE